MKKIVCMFLAVVALAFASPQHLANISDLKESIVILIENQQSLYEKFEEITKNQEALSQELKNIKEKVENLKMPKEAKKEIADDVLSKIDTKISEVQNKMKEDLKNNSENTDERINEILLAIENEQARDEKQIQSGDLRLIIRGEIKKEVETLTDEISKLKSEMKQPTIINLDEYIISKDGYKKKGDLIKKERNTQELLTLTGRVKKLEAENQEILKQLEGGKDTKNEERSLSDEEIKKSLDWMNYKIDTLQERVRGCCKKNDEESVVFEYELK